MSNENDVMNALAEESPRAHGYPGKSWDRIDQQALVLRDDIELALPKKAEANDAAIASAS